MAETNAEFCAEIDRLCAGATNGPWFYDLNRTVAVATEDDEWGESIAQLPAGVKHPYSEQDKNNMKLFAASRTLLPEAAKRIHELEAELAEARNKAMEEACVEFCDWCSKRPDAPVRLVRGDWVHCDETTGEPMCDCKASRIRALKGGR